MNQQIQHVVALKCETVIPFNHWKTQVYQTIMDAGVWGGGVIFHLLSTGKLMKTGVNERKTRMTDA